MQVLLLTIVTTELERYIYVVVGGGGGGGGRELGRCTETFGLLLYLDHGKAKKQPPLPLCGVGGIKFC